MQVLSIGYGTHLFEDNADQRRLVACAEATDGFHSLIFSNRSDQLVETSVTDKFHLYPTNSSSKFSKFYDAIKLGRKLIRQHDITVISSQDPFEAGLVGLILKWQFPTIRLQVQEHGDVLSSPHWKQENWGNRLRFYLGLFILKRADIVRVVSKRTELALRQRLGTKADIRLLPVVIDTDKFSVGTHQGSLRDNFTFLTAARFVPQKNLSLLLRAFKTASQEVSSLRLRILGEGPLGNSLQKQIEALGIEEMVTLAGWTNDLGQELAIADAYVLSSNYEGWGRVLIEAMLVGLPTVTTDVGCVGEVFIDQQHGLVVPVADQDALSEAMTKLATDTELYRSIKDELKLVTADSLSGTDTSSYARSWLDTMV
jgi:glycosyltransferase involved in cell wall biosynthesis